MHSNYHFVLYTNVLTLYSCLVDILVFYNNKEHLRKSSFFANICLLCAMWTHNLQILDYNDQKSM